jgi:hypothetical protein
MLMTRRVLDFGIVRRTRQISMLLMTILIWGSCIAAGLAYLREYETTPGVARPQPTSWQATSKLEFMPGKFNCVMMVHPRCPCSLASLRELRSLVERHPDQIAVHILFWVPSQSGSEWNQTEAWHLASLIPMARLYSDEEGIEAELFGATTSGHTILFQSDGTRIFSGGLTVSRGASNDGSGQQVISRVIDGTKSCERSTPVFGCPLFDPPAACREVADPGHE